MPIIGQRQASPEIDTHLHANFVTTTVFTHPTTVPPRKSDHLIPIGAIVGGVVAGALLAVMVTVGWVCWGKSIKRANAKERRKAEAIRRTRANTLQNARSSKLQSIDSYRPLFGRPVEKKIKFIGHDDTKIKEFNLDTPPVSLVHERHLVTPSHITKPSIPSKVSSPKPLRSVKGSTQLAALAESTDKPPLSHTPSHEITHKPSTVSSVSVYSTASGEEHQVRVPSNLILAALGNIGSSVDAAIRNSHVGSEERNSMASSGRSLFSKLAPGVRYSQASSHSSQHPAIDDSGMPIGLAI